MLSCPECASEAAQRVAEPPLFALHRGLEGRDVCVTFYGADRRCCVHVVLCGWQLAQARLKGHFERDTNALKIISASKLKGLSAANTHVGTLHVVSALAMAPRQGM